MNKKQIILIVLDGWGHREDGTHNAIATAKTPYFDSLWRDFPHTVLDASGEEVGLPTGQIGNSEVGHMTIGAGCVIDTDLVRITKAMRANEFMTNPAISAAFDHVKKNDSTLHIIGLLSPGGVHSHEAHAHGLFRAAHATGITKIAIHAFTDGRDTPPQSAVTSLKALEELIEELGVGKIASASGRFYAMDRDNNWDRLEKAEEALFTGTGNKTNQKASDHIHELHGNGIIDEHLVPTLFVAEDGTATTIQKNDAVVFFNFRPDRARMFSKKIAEKASEMNLAFATLTRYDETVQSLVAFAPGTIETTIAAEISRAGLTQAHIAETEKYAHATYFLNGGNEKEHPNEAWILLESRKDIQTHDLAPKMRAQEIADAAITEIEKGTNFLFINFANADMVGHTANEPAIVEAVEEVDKQLARVGAALAAQNGVMFITADHGNAETNIDEQSGERHTAHTMNKVPAIITEAGLTLRANAGLADIAPTVLKLLNLPIPKVMSGESLF
jgi:2,3-bisphosphoglycerate-independent phosphoglycerate mutase